MNHSLLHIYIGGFLLFPLLASAFEPIPFQKNIPVFRTKKVYAAYTFGKGLSVGSFQTAGAYLDWDAQDMQPFIDIRQYYFGNQLWGGSCGSGIRLLNYEEKSAIGWNIFYDYRQAHHTYHQIGVGFETSLANIDLIANCYIPLGRRSFFSQETTFYYSGGYFANVKTYRSALQGGDIELGINWNQHSLNSPIHFYTAIGAYHYLKNGGNCGFTGGMLKIRLNIQTYASLSMKATYDPSFKNTLQGCVAINFLFDESGIILNKKAEFQPFFNGITGKVVRRNSIILESRPTCCWHTNFH